MGAGRRRLPGIKYLHANRFISTDTARCKTAKRAENVCAVGIRYLPTKKAKGKLEREREGGRETPNGGFSGEESEKLSPLSSEWGARSQPEALGPGAAGGLH